MKKSVNVPVALSAILAATSCFLAFKLIDAGISLDHSRMEARACGERADSALIAANQMWTGASVAQAEAFGRTAAAQGLDVQKRRSHLLVGDVQFNFSEGLVKSLTWMQDTSDEQLLHTP